MMTSQKPNIGVGMICIHHTITRGLDVAINYAGQFTREGFPDEERREGFLNYLRSLSSVLQGHHLTEDELAFPKMQPKFPKAPFTALTGDHQKIATAIKRLNIAIDACAAFPENHARLKDVQDVLKEIDSIWHRHIAVEEEHFTVEELGRVFAPEEHMAMGREFSEHTQKTMGPDYLVVPFILYNLAPDERAMMAGMMPPVLTEQLVPIDWKHQWLSMQPFFLS